MKAEESATNTVTHPWGEVTYDAAGKATLLRFRTHEGAELLEKNPSEGQLKGRQQFYEAYKDYYAELDEAQNIEDGVRRRMVITEIMRKYSTPEERARQDAVTERIGKTWFAFFETNEFWANVALNNEDYLFSDRKEWIKNTHALYHEKLRAYDKKIQNARAQLQEFEKIMGSLQRAETTTFQQLIVQDYDEWLKPKKKKIKEAAP
jgi:hypothetical protein